MVNNFHYQGPLKGIWKSFAQTPADSRANVDQVQGTREEYFMHIIVYLRFVSPNLSMYTL